MKEIYLDNAATTKPRKEVMDIMRQAEEQFFYNTAALHSGGMRVHAQISKSAEIIKKRLSKGNKGEVIFTAGATESNNIVIFGKITNVRNHLVVLAGEHSSVYAPATYLKHAGFDVDFVPLKTDGSADLDALCRLITPRTALFVFGLVNSDTGVIQDAQAITRLVKKINPSVHVHCDAVQAFCKMDFDVAELGLDSVSISAHKIYGPKGVGALWLRNGSKLRPIMYGGSQQDFRPGTENNPGIIGFARAVELFDTHAHGRKISALKHYIVDNLPHGCRVIGHNTSPYILNFMLPNIFGQTVMNALSSRGIYVGLGSACNSTASKNRTLLAMGIPEKQSRNVLRISLGIYNTIEEMEVFITELKRILHELN